MTKRITFIALFMFWSFFVAVLSASFVSRDINKKIAVSAMVPGNLDLNLTSTQGKSGANLYTLDQVAVHNTTSDCWMVVDGVVSNVTSYLSKHPGGYEAMIPYCGKDASLAFDGKPHSTRARQINNSFGIGRLALAVSNAPGTAVKNNMATNIPSAGSQIVPVVKSPAVGTGQSQSLVLSVAEVAKHNSVSDCWLIINNVVSNVTSYLKQHPGGVGAISPYCGKDATLAFGGKPHSARASAINDSLAIGTVGQVVTANSSGTSGSSVIPSPSIPTSILGGEEDDDD